MNFTFGYRCALRQSASDRRASHRHDRAAARTGHAQLQVRRGPETRGAVVQGRASRGRGRQRTQSPAAGRVAAVPGGVPRKAGLRLRHVLVHSVQPFRRSRQQKSQPGGHV